VAPLIIRLTDAISPSSYLYINTEFWGSNTNENLIAVYDRKNRKNYFSPNKLWISSPSPDNWLTYDFAIGPTGSVATVKDSFGAVLWQSPAITGAGTSNLPNGLSLSLYGEYSVDGNSPVETCIDKVVITDDFVSDPSGIAGVKSQSSGSAVGCAGIVSAVYDDSFYIETPDRSSGIRVAQAQGRRTLGESIWVIGIVDTLDSGERYINPSVVTPM
jgi:hypothetical protein